MIHTTPELMKFKRLQRRLGESTRGTIGLLEMLWQATAKNCPLGDIGKFSNEEIAIMCDWEGDPDDLISGLFETGWIDLHEEHRLVVHDWHQHAPKFVKGVAGRSGGFLSSKNALRVTDPKSATLSSLLRVGNWRARVLPNQTKPNLTNGDMSTYHLSDSPEDESGREPEKPKPKKRQRRTYPKEFSDWYRVYPKPGSKRKAEPAYYRAVKVVAKDRECSDEEAQAILKSAAEDYAKSREGQDPQYTKLPATWLNGGCWDDEITPAAKQSRVATADDLANWRP